ncbi:MAG: hypothetical protein IJA97_05565 [Clostridia bacterium]|nr:hypothetical protein [Clostridia bacterium]
MILAKNEIILNEWNYATSNKFSSKRKNTEHVLTVTNKRVVSTVSNKRKIDRREVAIEAIQNISLRHEMPSKLAPVLMILLSVLLIAGCVVLAVLLKNLYVTIGAILVGVIAFCIFLDAVLNLKKSHFYIELFTNTLSENTVMAVNHDSFYRVPRIRKKVRIVVDNKIARDIIEQLGAIIFEFK